MNTTATTSRTLTAADRCDACGAQAYVHYGLPTGELFFCGHHARRFAPGLEGRATVLSDETGRLEGKTV